MKIPLLRVCVIALLVGTAFTSTQANASRTNDGNKVGIPTPQLQSSQKVQSFSTDRLNSTASGQKQTVFSVQPKNNAGNVSISSTGKGSFGPSANVATVVPEPTTLLLLGTGLLGAIRYRSRNKRSE